MDSFEAYLPAGFEIVLAELSGGRLFAVGDGPSGSISDDAGRTWSVPHPFRCEGQRLDANVHSVLRLKSGRLGMIYSTRDLTFATPATEWHFSVSDEGETWERGVALDRPAPASPEHGLSLAHPYGALRQLSGGRLILPVYWQFNGLHEATRKSAGSGLLNGQKVVLEGHGHRPEMGACYAYYSDDQGRTWKRSIGSIMVWPLSNERGLGGFAGTYEPVVIELKDGRVLMFLRTKAGRMFQSLSDDGGIHWGAATATELSSGDVPCDLGRIPSTGDLLVIWNQTSAPEIRRGYYRGRLSVAVSSDEGRTWRNFKNVECSPGLDSTVTRVQAPPVEHVRTDPNAGALAKGFSMYHYPRLAFVGNKVVMTYQADTDLIGNPPQMMWRGKVKVRAVPEKWFYQ